MELVIPAIVILVGNLFSGGYGSRRWKYVTALFGWVGGVAGALGLLFTVLEAFGVEPRIGRFFFYVSAFCVLQALSRDYERWLKPLVERWIAARNRKG